MSAETPVTNPAPDPRWVEDLIAAGVITLKRSRRADIANEYTLAAISTAADWLYAQARQLRERR